MQGGKPRDSGTVRAVVAARSTICIRAAVCIHSRGKQTGNYLKRARPGIRICSFAQIIPHVLESERSRELTNAGIAVPFFFSSRHFRHNSAPPKFQIGLGRSRRGRTSRSAMNKYGFKINPAAYFNFHDTGRVKDSIRSSSRLRKIITTIAIFDTNSRQIPACNARE